MPSGPCIVCGDTNYPASMGGPSICPPCDCGVSPKRRKLEQKIRDLESELFNLRLKGCEPMSAEEREEHFRKLLNPEPTPVHMVTMADLHFRE